MAVLLTHGHVDHTFSVLPVCEARDVPAYIHPADRDAARRPVDLVGLAPGAPIMGMSELTFAEPDDVRELADGATSARRPRLRRPARTRAQPRLGGVRPTEADGRPR